MIEKLADLVSPILLPMGVSYADILFYLNAISNYLLIGLAALVILVAVLIAAVKVKKGYKLFVRGQAIVAFLACLVILVNAVCYGPLHNTLSAYLNASRVELAEDTVAQSLATIEKTGEEGIVLLKNEESALPLSADVTKLNVFGWASTKPFIGGTGSSASSAAAATDILQSLRNAGYELNESLTDLYVSYAAERPTSDMFGQDLTLPEPTADYYTDELMAEAEAFSDTALIVIARGGGENYDLPMDMKAVIDGTYNIAETVSVAAENYPYTKVSYHNNGDYDDFDAGESYLELSNTEEAMIDLVCSHFDNVIVLINACNPMELGWVDEYEQIGAVLLAPAPGVQGFAALGNILNGSVNPSGRTVDTFVYDLMSTPTVNNVGINAYTNIEDLKRSIADADSTYQGSAGFVNYVEGIYVGYKFYETAAEEGLIAYDEVVQYPFGYGLSYTTFEKTIESFSDDGDSVSFTVNIKNTGDVAGKDVVQVYFTPPYTNGGIEKASANLIDFAKTSLIEPGSSEKIYFSIAKEDMASYDSEGVKIEGGGYILEAGEYAVSVRSDSHTVDDERAFTVDADIDYSAEGRASDAEAAVNQFDYARGGFEQLSRADGFANYDAACGRALEAADYEMDAETLATVEASVMGGYDPTLYDDPEAEMPTMAADNGLALADMTGLDYDDPLWEQLLDEMTYAEMKQLVNVGGWQTAEVKSIEKRATSDCDGPAGLNNYITGSYGTSYPSEVLMAQTWSKDMAFEIGASMGSEFAAAENFGWYGPAMNIHRSAFAGRNFEYYSEDGVLSGIFAMHEANGAAQFGVYPYLKHFALNDQELGRTAILLTYASEQAMREIYLRPFEIAVKGFEGDSLAMMTAYNWIGDVPAYANSDLLNDVLRGEWGFEGMVITDYFGSYGYMISDNCLRNGNDLMLGYGSYESNELDSSSATLVNAMRQACKNILYTVANSGYYADGETTEAVNHMDELFKTVNTAAIAILGVLELALLIQLALQVRKQKKNKA